MTDHSKDPHRMNVSSSAKLIFSMNVVTFTWFDNMCVRRNEQKKFLFGSFVYKFLRTSTVQTHFRIEYTNTLLKFLQLLDYCSVQPDGRLVGLNSFWKFQCMIHVSMDDVDTNSPIKMMRKLFLFIKTNDYHLKYVKDNSISLYFSSWRKSTKI